MSCCRMLVACLLIPFASVANAADLNAIKSWLPSDVNAVSIIRAGEIMKSPRAVREDWAKSADAAFLAGAMTLPSDVDVLVRGSHLYPGMAAGNWSVAFLLFSRPVDMQRVAMHERSTIQTVAGKPAVYSTRNAYFAQIDTQILGIVSPAYRQQLARLIQHGTRGDANDLSEYLSEATADPSQIVLAMDLADMFEPDRLRRRLSAATMMKGHDADLDRVASLCMNVRGIRLSIAIGEHSDAKLSIDFGADVGTDGELVKSLLLEILADMGASIDALVSSKVSVEGKSVRLTAVFEDEDLRRVMSLVTSPHSGGMEMPAASETPGSTAPRISAEASRKYFKAVDQIITDLRRANARANDYAKTATWHDNFANKIDHLSTVAVDEELVQFGQNVSADLRAVAASLRGVAVDVNTLEQSVTYNTTYTPGYEQIGWWSYGYSPPSYNVTSNLEEVRGKQAESVIAGSKDRDQVWLMITNGRARVLNSMKQKYSPEFDKVK